MRKFRFIGTEEDISHYTPDIADNLVIGKIYSEEDLEGLYLDCWQSPEKNLIESDWEEVFDEEIVEDALKVEYHGSGYSDTYYQGDKNILSISGTFGDVVFSLSGNFEKCLTVLNFISSLEVEKK